MALELKARIAVVIVVVGGVVVVVVVVVEAAVAVVVVVVVDAVVNVHPYVLDTGTVPISRQS
jgi:hypothetical protein